MATLFASGRRRLEPAAVLGVLARELVNFRSYWRSTTFSSTVEPTIYLLAFGFGFGALLSRVDGLDYIEFVGTGTVATAVLFSSVFPGLYETFIKGEFQRTYDAILAAPVDTEELVTGDALWIATRGGMYSCTPLVLSMAFGLHPSWGMLTVPLIGFLTGFGWATFGILVAAVLKLIENFNYVTSIVVTPLFLTAGTYFPISALPKWAQILANVNPLYHCVQLVRHAVFGFHGLIDLYHVGALAVFGLICWRLAVWRTARSGTALRSVEAAGRGSGRDEIGVRGR
jgi:lipooligosaccharide transport system permease protein